MTEIWELYEQKINHLKSQKFKCLVTLKIINKNLAKVELQYKKWQEETN